MSDRNHPFLEPIVKLAEDRGFVSIAGYLRKSLADPSLTHDRGDCGRIDHVFTDEEKRFQQVVDNGGHAGARSMLASDPSLALNELAFWGEGILSVPANNADRDMLELLMEHGASVPQLSKWGARYYFKHLDIARFLLENGMDANHASWRGFTLLHEMAFTGETEKARLLIRHNANLNAIDSEYNTTPLGYARHFRQPAIETLLLDAGAALL